MRESVTVIIPTTFKDNLLFIGVTNRRWGKFSCPGGKLDPGENIEKGARRELFEETGISDVQLSYLGAFPHKAVARDSNDIWNCHAFIGRTNEMPKAVESGTYPLWLTKNQLINDSLYPEWYKTVIPLVESWLVSNDMQDIS